MQVQFAIVSCLWNDRVYVCVPLEWRQHRQYTRVIVDGSALVSRVDPRFRIAVTLNKEAHYPPGPMEVPPDVKYPIARMHVCLAQVKIIHQLVICIFRIASVHRTEECGGWQWVVSYHSKCLLRHCFRRRVSPTTPLNPKWSDRGHPSLSLHTLRQRRTPRTLSSRRSPAVP